MSSLSPSANWLSAHLCRAKGSVRRRQREISRIRDRIAYHNHFLDICKAQLSYLEEQADQDQSRLQAATTAIGLHEAAPDGESLPTIGPHEFRITGFGGLTRSILRALRAGAMRIDDLRTLLASEFNIGEDRLRTFRVRLDVRLNRMKVIGTVMILDPPASVGRRWAINPEYKKVPRGRRPELPGPSYHSIAQVTSAKWLVTTQQELRELAQSTGAPTESSNRLSLMSDAVEEVWRQHAYYFEVADGHHSPASRRRQTVVRNCVLERLRRATAPMIDVDFRDSDDPVRYHHRPVSLATIRKALKGLLLEGLVHRHVNELGELPTWSIASAR